MASAGRVFRALRPLPRAFALGLLALSAVWLAWAAWAMRLSPSPDYAIVLDMVRDMASGDRFPVFYYGQAYMGTLEPAVSALLCAVFGFSPFAVALGTALVAWSACAAVAFFARRAAGWTGAAVSLLLLLPGPFFWVHFLASPRGGYAVAVLLAVLGCGIAATARLDAEPADGPGPRRRVRTAPPAAFGFVCGLALWNNLLAVPALLGGALVLAGRLRGRLFSPRVWLPGALAFAAGSAPWWIWNAFHDWNGLVFSAGPPPTGTLNALRALAGPVLREFLGLAAPHPAAADALPALLFALAATAAAGLAASRSRTALLLGTAAALHAAVFVVFWGKTSFGATAPARYLLPVFATAAMAGGAGLARLASGRSAVRRFAGAAAVAAAGAVSVLLGAVTVPKLAGMETWCDELFRETGEALAGLSGPAYADYALERIAWTTGRTVVPVSPLRCRQPWRLPELEASDAPPVFGDFADFGRFLGTSGGTGRPVDGPIPYRTGLEPPPPAAEWTPDGAPPALAGADGTDLSAALLDSDLATAVLPAAVPGGIHPIDVSFPAPVACCGIVLVFAPGPTVAGLRAEAVLEDGSRELLAETPRHRGWHWSGPRPWFCGSSDRLEFRWAPRPVAALRISVLARPGETPLSPALLRFLVPSDAPSPDPDAIRGELSRLSASSGPVRFMADRWLRARLGNEPEPSVRFPPPPPGAMDRFTRIDPAENTLVAVPVGLRAETRRLLEESGLGFEETAVAGAALFHLPGTASPPPFFRTAALRFAHGRLLIDTGTDGE